MGYCKFGYLPKLALKGINIWMEVELASQQKVEIYMQYYICVKFWKYRHRFFFFWPYGYCF